MNYGTVWSANVLQGFQQCNLTSIVKCGVVVINCDRCVGMGGMGKVIGGQYCECIAFVG